MPKVVTESERAQKQRIILDAAAAEIARFGYDRANINTIAERAGIGRGTIYLYFASKDDVLSALLDTIGAMIDDAVTTALLGDMPWHERLRRLTQAFAALADAHEDFFRVHVSALHGVNRAIGAPMAQWLARSVDRLANALQQAIDRGEIRPLASLSGATLILGALSSLALLPRALSQSDEHASERAETLATLLWQGITPTYEQK